MSNDNLTEFLTEGLDDEQSQELGDLRQVSQHLSDWQTPQPTPQEKQKLVARLMQDVPRVEAKRFGWRGWLNLIFAQARLFEPEFWYACAGMLALLIASGWLVGAETLPLIIIFCSPLIAMAGVLYAFHHESESLAVLEMLSPAGPLALFFCRSGLILGVNLVLFTGLLLPLEILLPWINFWRVAAIWLGVLVGLFGLAVFTATRWNGILAIVLPLGMWGLILGVSCQQAFAMTGEWEKVITVMLTSVNSSDFVLKLALAGLVTGSLLFFESARKAQQVKTRWA